MNQNEMIALLQIYIHVMTGQQVNITPRMGEAGALLAAYTVAAKWYSDNNIKITQI